MGLVLVALGSLFVGSDVNAQGGIELSSLPNSGFTATAGMSLLVTGTFKNLDEIHVGVCKEPTGSSSWFTATMNNGNYYANVMIPKEENKDFSECEGNVRILAYGWNELNDDFARRQVQLICKTFLPIVIKGT